MGSSLQHADSIICPKCFNDEVLRRKFSEEAGEKYVDCSFSNFVGGEEAKVNCKKYARNHKSFLTLVGEAGRGKTHLAIATLREYLLQGGSIDYTKFATLHRVLNILRKGAFEDGVDTKCKYINCEFLVIDDLGLDKTSNWGRGVLGEIIYERDAHALPTIVTTNLTLEEIAETFGERVVSRLGEGVTIKLEGPDYRLKKKMDTY